eukprot:TRINITY_DN38701_c0_g1_i1.p1 TRINITY_DN38701_c0_g1~~TRINITY_DN38701_c0_g1_i1.p1  ORF type:complete len:358 (+),score=49.81 TRINITY_DN38701_c0_g1_i1:101-1174(+)
MALPLYLSCNLNVANKCLIRAAGSDDTAVVAVLDVPDTSLYEVTCTLKGTDGDYISALFGIAAVSPRENLEMGPGRFTIDHGYFYHAAGGADEFGPKSLEVKNLLVDGSRFDLEELRTSQLPECLNRCLKQGDVVRICHRSGQHPTLAVSIQSNGLEPLAFVIGEGEYRPCIVLQDWVGQEIEVTRVGFPSMIKRRYEERILVGNYEMLWRDRSFSDATIVCGDESFAVHRCVLCKASAVFASAFNGQMTEGAQARLDLTGEDPNVVAALLEHAYTAKLRKDADPVALLPLADRFELFDCVDDCSEAIEILLPRRAVDVVRMLRPYAHDERLRRTWDRVCDKVLADRSAAMAVMRFM